ncbi:histidine kinase [Labilibaculum sp. DW002]|uniref:Histidine kinase n=1 Tax=Paralabilibaculum antarcticum TaxID=2912572 RepID=A0ABT5VQ21_9BACT|nr:MULTISPECIES: histidine kinase [unclassified Labilibaculum]MBI9059330.1 histidine kinase [Labilibaculum sp.]MDE5416877.1 histidine kinase [Labilibaculum sp. DW002]
MQHPLLKNRLALVVYLASWIFFTALLFIIGWYFEGRSINDAIINAFSFCFPLLILGACIWFVVVYVSIENLGVWGFILHHFTAGIIVVGIWVSLAYQLRVVLFGAASEGLDYIIPVHWQVFMAFGIYDYIILLYYLIIYYRNFQDKLLHESELKELVKEAELTALKSQINPHFLFNSLNSVSSLTLSKPEKSREMVVKLSTYLRYSLAQDLKELNSLCNELSNIRLYMEIEKVRFGDRLNLDFDLSSNCENLKIPNLILQPLYENAIKFGVHESLDPVSVKTKCRVENNILKISISNNFDPTSIPPKGNGIGLQNIQERLNLIYGRSDLMRIVKGEKNFTVNLEFPQVNKL